MVGLAFSAQEHLGDQLLIAYFDWYEACLRLKESYRAWTRAGAGKASYEFGQCIAALDAEESAADEYARTVLRADRRRARTTARR
jgi:hypothetical protein